ncbi:MAG: proline dehydrogenase family protein [Nitrospinaceae bacterium]|jgi:proline dehydrogenase|nr:proline dehydrogenase family protein [Nitrospinaceae bacterium]MDP7148049.1 proline dehydrogenase family protein [Nitrospinaceae bacterium]
MNILYPFAKRFIAGEDLPTAMKSIQSLQTSGYLSTVDILGENTHRRDQAQQAQKSYLDLLNQVDKESLPMDLSLKVTQMGLDIDWELCKKNISEILNAASGHTVRFDIEGSDYTKQTINLCIELHETYRNLGQALQAYLYRTGGDVERLLDQGISIRLCKGAYKESATNAWTSMEDIRANFLTLAKIILKEGFLPAIATHDEYILTEILEFVKKENISPKSFYFEMLYGVRRDIHKALLDKGYQVRIYVPYGKSWLPYTLRRLTEKKGNILFVMRHLFRETFGLSKIN